MRCVVYTGAGGYEVIDVVERPDPVPGSGELLVNVRYAGLNPADSAQRAGRYPAPPGSPPDVPGLEVAGVVADRGRGVQGYEVGDRVFGLVGGGGLADRVVVHERCVARIPESLEERDAAAVPEAFVTAHDALRSRGRLAPGETLLVHGATGGVGSAAVQIGLAMGARVIAVVRGDHGADFAGSLGAESVRDDGYVAAVRASTGGRGADVILETVGGSHFPADIEALAPLGRVVVLSVASGTTAEVPLHQLMAKRAEVHGSMLRARSLEDKALAIRAFEREVLPALASGRIRPLVDEVYPLADVRGAYERLDGAGKRGKVLVEFG